MRFVIVLFCLLFAARVLADNHAYYEGYLPVKSSVGKKELNSKVLLVTQRDAFELTIIPEGEDEDPLVFAITLGEEWKIFDAEGKQQIGEGKRIGEGDNFQLEFAHIHKGMKIGNVSLQLRFGGHDANEVELDFKLVSTFDMTLETKGRLVADLEKTMRCRWGNGSDSDC